MIGRLHALIEWWYQILRYSGDEDRWHESGIDPLYIAIGAFTQSR